MGLVNFLKRRAPAQLLSRRGFRFLIAVSVVGLLVAASAAQAITRHSPHDARPVARLTVDDSQIRTGDVVRADLRASRLPRGAIATLAFGDGSRRLRLSRLAIETHRFGRTGRFTITVSIRSRGSLSVATRRIMVRPRIIHIRPKPKTLLLAGDALESVQGDPQGQQIVILSHGSSRHQLGSILSIAGSARFPQGVLGKVVAASTLPGGATQLTLAPVGLSDAYQTVNIATGGSLTDSGAVVENDQGQVLGPASDFGALQPHSIHFGGSGIRCTGGVTPPIDVNLDLSGLHWDLSFTYPSPSIHFLVTGSPTLTVDAGINAAIECHYTLPLHIVVPIPGTPLQVKISPRIELSTSGSLGFHAKWSPRLTYGFDRGNGISQEVHVFNLGQPDFQWGAQGKGDLFIGPDAELSVGGRVGVSATFGPDLAVSRENGCTDAYAGLKVTASAEADIFIARWEFTLWSGYIMGGRFYHNCDSAPAPPSTGPAGGTSGGTSSPTGGSSGGSAGGGSSGAGSSPSVPGGSYAETVGGVTHTWTNYTNAGGTQGPSIQTGQTVGVACKIQGFKVADGDTWWYQIASSPWNSVYYASADAFYNNGQTSGSLIGTPFVDNNVPNCPGSQPPPPPPAPTWAETVGGVTHTWTNYTNAGGTQGPSIQTGQTVAVACKVPGFRVADGDTWWYRIQSSPWNGAYYASADAFYNNGQTSGSLIGTPFVDNNVANC